LVAHLAKVLREHVTITDGPRPLPDARREFAEPGDIPSENNIVFHASGTGVGLETAINLWVRSQHRRTQLVWISLVTVNLGGPFHSRRLRSSLPFATPR
jgi:hypothetical protein